MGTFDEKNGSKKSRANVPLNNTIPIECTPLDKC